MLYPNNTNLGKSQPPTYVYPNWRGVFKNSIPIIIVTYSLEFFVK